MNENTRVTIVAEDAERLVAEGGVHNRVGPHYAGGRSYRMGCTCPWDEVGNPIGGEHGGLCPTQTPDVPFDADVWEDVGGCDIPGCQHGIPKGAARVVDVHHSMQCLKSRTWGGYCHDGALPDRWHWIVEPVGGDTA